MTFTRAGRSYGLVAALGMTGLFTLPFAAQQAVAEDSLWNLPVNGSFNVDDNWFGGVPGLFDRARFEITRSNNPSLQRTYSVDFTNNPINDQLVLEDDNVTFDLNGHTYTVLNDFVGVALGTVSNRSGNLTVTGGTVSLDDGADLEIAPVAGARGVLTVGAGGSIIGSPIGSPDVQVGLNGNGTLNVLNGGDVTAASTVLGRNSNSTGTATVSGMGSTLTTGSLTIGVDGSGTLEIRDGGSVEVTSSEVAAEIGSGTVIVGANGFLRARYQLFLGYDSVGQGTLRIQTGGRLIVDQVVALGRNAALHLEGGTLFAQAFNFSLGIQPFFWTSGKLLFAEFGDDLTIPNGGVLVTNFLAPSHVSGNLTLLPGATTQVSIYDTWGDQIQVDGHVVLGGGILQLSPDNSVLPSQDEVEIMTTGDGIFGSFANVANGQRLATSDRLGSFLVHYGPGSSFDPTSVFISSYLPATPGDFDVDGDVDGTDFLFWQRGDSPTPGSVADLVAWRVNFGAGASHSAGVLVAEPCSATGLLVASSAFLFSHRCRRRQVDFPVLSSSAPHHLPAARSWLMWK